MSRAAQPTDVPCLRCGGIGENTAPEGVDDMRNCPRCVGSGVDPQIVRWHRPVARASLYVDTARPCLQCQGGEWGDCGLCLGSGFAAATHPEGGWSALWAECPWTPEGPV